MSNLFTQLQQAKEQQREEVRVVTTSTLPSAPTQKNALTKAQKPKAKLTSLPASTLASSQDEMIARIRKVVRTPGKDVGYIRMTTEEKQQLADIVYTYKRQGVKLTENEITRIAVNFLLGDYQANGATSILVKVIDALLA
jgi:hypothetical protein